MDPESPPFALTREEYELVGALAEAVVPSGDDPILEPGANEVGVKNFFDSTVLAMSDYQRGRTKEALALVARRAEDMFVGSKFQRLSLQERELVLESMLTDGKSKQFLVELRAICISGFFSDYRDPGYAGTGGWDWTEFTGKRISDVRKDWSFLRIHQQRAGADE